MSEKPKTPAFKVGDDFYAWEKEVQVWQIVTTLDETKQGAALFLALDGEAKDFCQSISVEELKAETGAQTVIDRIKELYGRDKDTIVYQALEDFETFKRGDQDISSFINEFDNRYYKVKTHCKMEYPNEALAYKLLKACCLSDDDNKLARATTNLDFKKMKDHLKTVFGKSAAKQCDDLPVKVEQMYLNDDSAPVLYNNNYAGSSSSGGRRYNRKKGYSKSYSKRKDKGNLNPIGKYNKRMRCYNCDAVTHLANACPDPVKHDWRDEKVTLFGKGVGDSYMSTLLYEALNHGVLDTGCLTSVAGKLWYEQYVETLLARGNIKSKSEMVVTSSKRSFKFGSGDSYGSLGRVKLPAYIENEMIYIEADIIDLDLPLLISSQAMKSANVKLEFGTDTVVFLGHKLKLKFATSGHYMISLLPELTQNSVHPVLLSINSNNDQERKRALLKLHLQFGHAIDSQLIQILKDAGYSDETLFDAVKKVSANCNICQVSKRQKSRPVVGFALGRELNDAVSMDLKFISGKVVLHIIDNATRYSAAAVLPSKRKEEIVEKFFMHWVCIFGTPKKILFDNGGEFCNELVEEMSELLNTEILTTAAESPWSNGITERHNAIIASMVDKVLLEVKCSLKVALAWSVAAKNALQNVYGFSPNQLVFGRNPNFPVAAESELPALDSRTASKMLANHLNALHEAREAFISAESSAKIKRALLRKTRTATVLEYPAGTKVYYKRSSDRKWKGPAAVLGSVNKQVIIKHGSFFYRVSPCHLNAVNENRVEKESLCRATAETPAVGTDTDSDTSAETSDTGDDGSSDASEYFSEDVGRDDTDSEAETEIEQPVYVNPISTSTGDVFPVIGSKVNYIAKDDSSNKWRTAHVISRAGKASGANKYWFNVHDEEETEPKSMNFETLKTWEQSTEEVLISVSSECSDVVQAKHREIENLKSHSVFTDVPNDGQPFINVTWVLSEKCKDGVNLIKARLVAKGYEEVWKDGHRKDSPTCLRETLHLIILFAANFNWNIRCLDIQSAFLQGKAIERELFLKPPAEANSSGRLWRLNKTIYGLNDAGRQWYLKVKEVLESLGVKMSVYEESLFYWLHEGSCEGIIGIHVDDFFFAGSNLFYSSVIKKLHEAFAISKEEELHFNFLGLQLHQLNDCITLDQKLYVQEMEPVPYESSQNKDTALSGSTFQALRSLIGQLSWVATHSRPDIAFEVCQLSVNLKQATLCDVKRANKCLKTLKGDDVALTFPKLGDVQNCSLISYSDASFANLTGCASQGGSIVFISNASGIAAPLSWHSRKLKRVVKSTTSAETLALLDGIEDCLLIRKIVGELTNGLVLSVIANVDSKNLRDSVYSSKTVEDKRLKIDLCTVRDYLRLKELSEVRLVDTKNQLADTLTKSGADATKLKAAIQGQLPV